MASDEPKTPVLTVESSPHVHQTLTTRRVMIDVLVGLIPAVIAGVLFFRLNAVTLIVTCCAAGVVTEWLFNRVRRKPDTLRDCSALVTGVILALSLPPSFPAYGAVIGTVVAVALGKMVYGGLGHNMFNPAMVGRAFLMACFPVLMTTWTPPVGSWPASTRPPAVDHKRAVGGDEQACVVATQADTQPSTTQTVATRPAMTQRTDAKTGAVKKWQKTGKQRAPAKASTDAVTQATPLQLVKSRQKATLARDAEAMPSPHLRACFLGYVGGCVGETSALALILGALYLLIRRTIAAEIPVAMLVTVAVVGSVTHLIDPARYADPLIHLTSGGVLLGAFFIATDPVTCPLTALGRWLFGFGVGALVMLIRLVGGYPEGVMYAVLLMNAVTPLLNRWTRPTPLGGHAR